MPFDVGRILRYVRLDGCPAEEQFAQQSHGEGSRSDGRIAYLHVTEFLVEDSFQSVQLFAVVCGDEPADAFPVFFCLTGLQVGDETFSAHVLYDFLRCIERTLVLVVFQQVLEHASEHFGVDSYFGIIRVVLIDGEIVLRKHSEQTVKVFGRKLYLLFVKRVAFEKTAVQIRDSAVPEAFHLGIVQVVPVGTVTV